MRGRVRDSARPPAGGSPGTRGAGGALLLAALCLFLAGCGSVRNKDSLAPDEGPADLYVDLSAEYLKLGQLEPALQHAQRALAEDRKSARAHYMLGLVQQRLGREQEAEDEIAEAVRLAPDNPDFRNALGFVLCGRGRYDAAIAEIEKAIANPLYKTPQVALMNAANCAERHGRNSDAETFLRRVLTRSPNYPPALFAMAQRSYARGDYKEARGYLARYSRVGATTPQALLLAAHIERKLGNAREAQALESALRRRFPDAPEIMQL
jgi:type IV pilus assembly protein PilF